MDHHDFKTSIRKLEFPGGGEGRRQACFIVISGGLAGSMFKLTSREMFVGRSEDTDICIDEEDVSRKHAKVETKAGGQVVITDMNSTNGTFVNGDRIRRHSLRDGDKIRIGSTTIMKFSYQDSVEERFQQGIFESATRDKLTGTYNRAFFTDRFPHEFGYSVRHNMPFSVVVFDIDHFKKINDSFGHQAGDHVLSEMAGEVSKLIRKENIFARYGGEEFVVLLRETPEDGAHSFAERLREAVEKHLFSFGGNTIPVTVSVGAATYKDGNFGNYDELLQAADKYLYKAKGKGRNRVESPITD